MSLEQGVRYNIVAAGKASLRTTNYKINKDLGLVQGLDGAPNLNVGISAKQIDYILQAKDSNNNFVPDVFFSSDTPFNFKTLVKMQASHSYLDAGHDSVSFFGADQTTFSNIKHNETLSGIENDTMYVLSSNCKVIYNNATYNYGSVLNTNSSDTAFTKTGSPLFLEVLNSGSANSSDKYYVYGSQKAISDEESVQVGSSAFFPGDVFTGVTGSIIVTSGVDVCLIKISEDKQNLKKWFLDDYSKSTLEVNKAYLIYDNISCLYNSSLIKPNPLLNNVFKTTLDSIHNQPEKIEWLNTSGSRKKPTIREIIKSSAVKPGEDYYLFHDRFTGYGRSNTVTYNDIQYSTSVVSDVQPVFKGLNLKSNYFTGYKSIDKKDAHKDPDVENTIPNSQNIDLQSGNPMVVKKEPIGLKAGQKYVFVAEPVTAIEEGKYYMLSKGNSITYNNATISIGQVFKGATDSSWETIGQKTGDSVYSDETEEVTLVTNKVTVNTFENNGASITLETTIKNRKVEFTASDDAVVPNSSPILYWTKPANAGKGYIYKSVDTLEEDKRYYVAAEGDGFVQYPPEDLTYDCLRSDKTVSAELNRASSLIGTKLTKTELDTQKNAYDSGINVSNTYSECIEADGEWAPETNAFSKTVKKLHNRDSFYAIKGKCEKDGERLWDKEIKDSCKDVTTDDGNNSVDEIAITTEWTPYTTFKEKKDSLLTYAITENTYDQSLIHEVVFKDEETEDVLPDDTKTPEQSPRSYNIAPLKQKLSQYQVLRFPQQGENKSEPTFIVAKNYSPTAADTSIEGWLLYEKIPVHDANNPSANLTNRTATASLEVEKTTNGASSVNPFNLYYAEPLELKVEEEAEETDTGITLYSLPCPLTVGELLSFKDGNGKISQFKVTVAAQASTSQTIVTGLIMCPESSSNKIAVDSIAKAYGKKVGTYCLNRKFKHNERFTGVSSRPIVRFKDRRRITTGVEISAGAPTVDVGEGVQNIEESAATNASIHKVEIKENSSSALSASFNYTVGGKGFVSKGEDIYHGEVSGRIMINHPLGGTSLKEYNKSKFPWYEDRYIITGQLGRVQKIQIFPASTHVPSGTKLYFPNAVFELTQNLEEGSDSMTGRVHLQVPTRARSPRRLYHQDECNFIFIEAETFTGGAQSVSTDSKSFVYRKSEETKYFDALGDDARSNSGEASSEKFSVVTDGQEYYIKVIPEEVSPKETDSGKFPIEENLEYIVKGTGETIELASSYDSTNLQATTGLSDNDREQTLNTVVGLKEALPVGTVLTFYPADQVRLINGSASFDSESYIPVHKGYDGRAAYDKVPAEIDGLKGDPNPAKTGGVRFTLTKAADVNETEITGRAEEKAWDKTWGNYILKGSMLVVGCVAETSRAVVYNGKTFRTGEAFTGDKNTESTSNLPDIYTQYSNNFLNSTKNEKVYAYNAYVDYFHEEDIMSGGEFNIVLNLVTNSLPYRQFTQGEITGSQSRFDFDGALLDSNGRLTNPNNDGRRKHFYYLPASPTLDLSVSSAKIYKVSHKYIDKNNSSTGSAENSYDFTSGITYKVGGTGDGYIDTSTNTDGKILPSLSGFKTFYPSSPCVYDKTPTSLEPNRFYILEYPETFSTTSIQALSTLKYNNKRYFSHNHDFADMGGSIKVKYYSGEHAVRFPMLNSYLFGRSVEPFVHNVRNSSENLGRPNFQKIHETEKRINGEQKYPDPEDGTILWENGLTSYNRYFDILDNSFETFNILRQEKYYGQWNKIKLAEQDVEGVRSFVNVVTNATPLRKNYEYSLAFGISGTDENGQNSVIKAQTFIRLVDSELLPSSVSDLNYKVESSQESYFSSPTGEDIQAVRTLQPRPENRLKANNRYYLTGGSIKYLGYDGDSGALKSVDDDTSETITSGKVFTGKADYFDKDDNRVYFGNSNKHVIKEIQSNGEYTGATEVVIGTNHEDKIIENRLGTFEFWNHVSDAPLVYPVIEQWEVEKNKTYHIVGDANVDRVEYDGKVYKPGESFKAKQIDFNQPFSGDQDMFTDMLGTSDYKEAAARGLKPWMDDSYFRPRERGYIPLTPLVYRAISTGNGNIKVNKKYIVKGSGTIKYNDKDYKASNSIAYPDNHFDATLATAYATNVRKKIRQNEKIKSGEKYYVYGAGKVKYIEQVKYTGESEILEGDHTSSGITFAAIGVDLPIYSVLSFSNGSTFILSESASSGATTLKGTLSGKIVTNSVAPVTKDKYNKQVEISKEYNNGSSVITISTVKLPFNIPRGEVLYFYSEANAAKGKLTVSENATAGEKKIKGLLENAGLTAGDKANIVYAREHVYREYVADGEFSDSSFFVGLRGYDYFEITEGNPEVYTDQNLTTAIGERYYVFGTSAIAHDSNSVSPSNVFYGKSSPTGFTVETGSPEVIEVVGIENLEAGSYTVYGNNDSGSEHWLFTHEGENKKHDDSIVWSAGEVVEKYKSLAGVQNPVDPVVYSKTLDIVRGGQTYKLQSLSSSEPRGVVKYVEKSGTCKNPSGASINSIQNAQDCLLEDTVRANLSHKTKPDKIHGGFSTTVDAITGVQGYTPGNYALGRDFEVFINDFSKYEPLEETLDEFTVDGQTYSTHKVVKYKILKANTAVLFFSGGVIVPSEDLWVEGKYIKPRDEPFHPSRKSLFEYDLDTCESYGGTWVEDESDENTYQTCKIEDANGVEVNVTSQESDHSGGGKEYIRLNKGKWIAVTIKGEIQTPVSIKHYEEAPLFSWLEDAKTAYFTTDGSSYTSGSITTIKKSKNGEIKNGITYTLAGGTEISYNGKIIKRNETFDGVPENLVFASIDEAKCKQLGGTWADSACSRSLSQWKFTRNSDGTEYLTSQGSETEFTGIPNYEEMEIVTGNPQVFLKGESFIIPEGEEDETYVVEGNSEIKVLSNDKVANLSSIKYSSQGGDSDEVDLFAKSGTTEALKPRGIEAPTNLSGAYHSGKFTGQSSETNYQLRTVNWSSDVWVYHDSDVIRAAKLRTDEQWRRTVNYLNDETFTWNGKTTDSFYANAGIVEAQDYIDIKPENDMEWGKTAKSVLVLEGFKIAYTGKKLPSFPSITPYSPKGQSQFQVTGSIKESRLLNLFNGRILKGSDAVLFGKGEIALYDYDEQIDDDEDSPALKSTTFIKAHSNLKTNSVEGETVLSSKGLKKNYRYIVTSIESESSPKIKESAIQIFNTNGYHNQQPDGAACTFGFNALDFFNNEVILGMRFKTVGVKNIYPEGSEKVNSAIFESTIFFKENTTYVEREYGDENQDSISVEALPVNLEAGEVLKKGVVTLTLSERALKGSTVVKGTVAGGDLSGSVTRKIELTISSVDGSKTQIEKINGSFKSIDSAGNDLECPTSLTDGQVSTSLGGTTGFSDSISAIVGTRFTSIMDSSFPSGITGVSYSNVITKSFFDVTHQDFIANPRVEYTKGDPKFLFILGAYNLDEGLISDETHYDHLPNGGADFPTNKEEEIIFRYHLYDLDYSEDDAAYVSIDEGTPKAVRNNFFIHNGTTTSFTPQSTKIKNNQGTVLGSKIYIYKEVLSGEITTGKTYLVYGTGSVMYNEIQVTADNEFIPFLNDKSDGEELLAFNCFKGVSGIVDFTTEQYQETFWNKSISTLNVNFHTNALINIADPEGASIEIKDKIKRVSVPRVFELVYFSHYEDGEANDAGNYSSTSLAAENKDTIYYVYGEGGIIYGEKKIYATNKYIVIGGQNYGDVDSGSVAVDNRVKPSSFVYAGKLKQTSGFEYEYNKDGVINPISKNHFFAENKYTLGNIEESYSSAAGTGSDDINRETDLIVHRKVHALEGIENNKTYKAISTVRGEGKIGMNSEGTANIDGAPLNSVIYGSDTVSPQGEQVAIANDISGQRVENSGEVIISGTETTDSLTASTPKLSKHPRFIVSRRKLSQMKRKGVSRTIMVEKCYGCVLETKAWYMGGSTGIVRSQSEFYSKKYLSSHAYVSSGEAVLTVGAITNISSRLYQVGKPRGFTYVVRGGGSIKYPVTSSGADYITSQNVNLTRIIPAGESFSPLEDDQNFIGVALAYIKKETGDETVYRIANPEDLPNYWKGLDRFAGMAPDRHGTTDGEIKQGISYRVLKYEAPKRTKGLGVNQKSSGKGLYIIRGEHGDKDEGGGFVIYNGTTVKVGEVFVGVSGKKSLDKAVGDRSGIFVREESGTYGNAPEEGWSNQWSMFMSQTVSSPSKTSLWHHDTYGDVLGFLNNRCHLHSLDFQGNKYSHLLQTFAYGIKPVIRSEAPSGYTYLEGSNAQQNWFAMQWLAPYIYDYASGKAKDVEADEFQDHLNMLYYRSCRIYRPDYPIDSIKCIDIGQYIKASDNGSSDFRLISDTSNEFQKGICIVGSRNQNVMDENACADLKGAWIPLKDMVEVKLNGRLDHRPNTRKIKKNLSRYSSGRGSYLSRLHKSLAPGPWAPESFRTDENAVIEYLIKQRKWRHASLSTVEEPYYTSYQCHKARIGDAAPDINVWHDPDDPWGACDSRFYFTKHIPYAHDNNDEKEASIKTPIEIKTFQQMEFYLRAMCGGFIDQESNPKPLEYGGIEPGLLPSSVPVCVMSKDYEYLFENLAYQSLNETEVGENNYKTVEMWHDDSNLLIKRVRRAKIERSIQLETVTENNYYHIYTGTGNKIPDQHIEKFFRPDDEWADPIGSFVPTTNREVFTDSYYVTLKDDFNGDKKQRIPAAQKYQVVLRDATHSIVGGVREMTAGISNTAIVEDFQDAAFIQWRVGKGIYYVLERKISLMPHYSEWIGVSGIRDIEASKEFGESNSFTQDWSMKLSPTDFEKIEFRIRVFFKETIFDNDRKSKIIEAITDDPNISSPISVKSIPDPDDPRMIDKDGSYFGGGSLATATETFSDGARTYKIKIVHNPALWLGNSRATTLSGKDRLFYRVEYRTLSSYPDGEGQEGDWEVVARFDNPTPGTNISYTDDTDYSFQNVSYRVSYVKERLGGVRWISPLLRDDRTGKPNDPKGYGPLQNVKLRAALFNQFANAINLLKEVRIDLPITVRTQNITTDWVTPHTELSSEPRTYTGNPNPPTWGIYAINEYAPGPHHTSTSFSSEHYFEELGTQSNYGAYKIGTQEDDEYVENGWFSACAHKGFGFAGRPWIMGNKAYVALYFYDQQVKLTVPNDQTAMTWAIPPRFLDMFRDKYVTLSGLNEYHNLTNTFDSWPESYFHTKYEIGNSSAAENMVFCRSLDETGFSKFGEAVYEPYFNSVHYYKQTSEFYRSWCGFVPGMAMLVGPPLDVSDNAFFITPMGVSGGASSNLVCSVGGAASSHCFTTRASTGDNNMTLTVEVLDIIRAKPFNSHRNHTGRESVAMGSWYIIPKPKMVGS